MFLKSQDHRQGNRHHRFSISAAAWGATHDLARRHPRYSVSIRAPRFREGRCIRDNWCDEYTKFQSALHLDTIENGGINFILRGNKIENRLEGLRLGFESKGFVERGKAEFRFHGTFDMKLNG